MLSYSFMEILWSTPLFYRSIKGLFVKTFESVSVRRRPARPASKAYDEVHDPALPHEQVQTLHWTLGLALSSIATLVVGKWSL